MNDKHHIAILGAGVIGLSTAISLLEEGYLVTVISKNIPSDPLPLPVEYASIWAGGHHVSFAKTEKELRHDQVTFEKMCQLMKQNGWGENKGDPLVWVHQTEYFTSLNKDGTDPCQTSLSWYPNWKQVAKENLPNDEIVSGCTFSTIDIHVPKYLLWLWEKVIQLGANVIVESIESISQAIQTAVVRSRNTVDALVVCPGLGAATLKELEDLQVCPQRGQVVVLSAPHLFTRLPSWSSSSSSIPSLPGFSIANKNGERETYIIPRGDGTVICGGTRILNDWDPNPRLETTKQILERCLKFCPDLVHPQKKKSPLGYPPVVSDIDSQVIAVNVGLRPTRINGSRLEIETKNDWNGVKVVHNYGYGGWGYQASWGAAYDAKELVKQSLSGRLAKSRL